MIADWYDDLAALGARCLVVIVPGTIAGHPVTAWFAAPILPPQAVDPDPAVRVALMVGACRELHARYAQQWGMQPLASKT